jgi:hypothetical protein
VETAWAALQRPDTWSRIGGVSSITNPRYDELGLAGYDFVVLAASKEYQGRATRSEAVTRSRMAMAIDTELLDGRIVVELFAGSGHTEVGVTMAMRSQGFMSTLLFPVISSAVGSGFATATESFAASLNRDPGS